MNILSSRGDAPIWVVTCKRLKAARESCGYSVDFVCEQYKGLSTAHLRKVEGGHKPPTMQLLIRLASLYNVSTDYLLGIRSEPDTSLRTASERVASVWVMDQWRQHEMAAAAAIENVAAKLSGYLESATHMTMAAEDVGRAFDEFITHNPEFDDMRGGARLVSRLTFLRNCAIQARSNIKRVRDLAPEACFDQGELDV